MMTLRLISLFFHQIKIISSPYSTFFFLFFFFSLSS